MMSITYRKATIKDIKILIKLRLKYLTTDSGELGKDETEVIVTQLQDYFTRQINGNFVAFLAEYDGEAISAVYMAVSEKPANPTFITGKTATILNVFTYPDYRCKGIATKLLEMIIDEAKSMDISYLELSATYSGKSLYEKFGFIHWQSKYTEMRLRLL